MYQIITKFFKSLGIDLRGSKQGLRDIAVSVVPQLIGVLSGLTCSILIARGLGPAGLGNYALIMSYIAIAGMFSNLGLGETAIRYTSLAVANNDLPWQSAVLQWALKLRMLMAVLAALILALLAPYITNQFWHNKDLSVYIYVALIGGIFVPLSAVPTIYFQSIRKFSTNSIITSGQRIIGLLGILILSLFNMWQLMYVILSTLIATIIGALAFILTVPKDIIFGRNDNVQPSTGKLISFIKCPDSSIGKRNHGENTSQFAAFQMTLTIVVMLTAQVDIWLMGFFLNSEQIGIYSAATRFTLPFAVLIATLNTVLWPRASACVTSKSKLDLMNKTFKLCFVLTFFGIIYSYFAPLSTAFFFGESYSEGVLLAQLLCARQCILLFYCSISLVGYSLGMIKHYVWIALVCFFVLIQCNIILLPVIGFYGAAVGLIVSEILQLLLGGTLIYFKYKNLKREVSLGYTQ